MGGELPKQYAALGRKTMLEHAVDALLAEERIESVLIVVAPDDARWARLTFDRRVAIATVGGATRADSVRNGLRVLAPRAQPGDCALVHDAARPCVTRAEVQRLIDTVGDSADGGLLAMPVADTIKREVDGRVAETVAREGLWRAATPQLFGLELLLRALDEAGDLAAVTDEAGAVERLGFHPCLVACASSNIKVTTPEDWALAEAILKAQGRWT